MIDWPLSDTLDAILIPPDPAEALPDAQLGELALRRIARWIDRDGSIDALGFLAAISEAANLLAQLDGRRPGTTESEISGSQSA